MTFCSEIQAPRTLSMVFCALEMPFRIASSKLPGDVEVISTTFAIGTNLLLLLLLLNRLHHLRIEHMFDRVFGPGREM